VRANPSIPAHGFPAGSAGPGPDQRDAVSFARISAVLGVRSPIFMKTGAGAGSGPGNGGKHHEVSSIPKPRIT
jgi:hypothetical protein